MKKLFLAIRHGELELIEDFTRIFQLLFLKGANPDELDSHCGKSLTEYYANEEVAQFIIKEAKCTKIQVSRWVDNV